MKVYPTDKLLASQTFAFARWKKTESTLRDPVVLHANAFLFVLKGKKILLDGDAALEVAPGHALLMRRGIHFMSEYIPEEEAFEALLIYFTDGLLERFLVQLASADPPPATAQDYALVGTSPLLTSFVEQYVQYFSVSAPPDALLELKTTELFYILATDKGFGAVDFFASLVQQPSDLKMLMAKVYKEKFTVQELAEMAGRSLSVFKREFEKDFGESPARWMIRQRLIEAKWHLTHTPKSVADIAYSLGFESVAHFDKAFKREFAHTPSAYRKAGAVGAK
ncbi:MAG: helix-turn-helix domain-containing protein [Janthinobacterium lividum]